MSNIIWSIGCCWLWFNVTFSIISAIKWQDSCPVYKFWPAAGAKLQWQLGVFSVPRLPWHGHRDVRRRLLSPRHQGAHMRRGLAGNRTLIVWFTVKPATSTPPLRAFPPLMKINWNQNVNPDGTIFGHILNNTNNINNIHVAWKRPLILNHTQKVVSRQKGGDLTQSYDKSPYTHRNVKRASDNANNVTKKFD